MKMRYLLLSIAALTAAQAAFGGQRAVDAEVVFNTPGFHDQATTTVEDKLVELIDQAVPGSQIRVSEYHLDRREIPAALNRASQRGVDVRLVLDGSDKKNFDVEGSGPNVLVKGDGHVGPLQCSDDSCIKLCKGPIHFKIGKNFFGGSCRGLVINHNKFMLFSELSTGAKDVVTQSSANLTDGQLHMYNDLVIIKNDHAFYSGMLDYWLALMSDKTSMTPFTDAVGESRVTAKFFPRLLQHDPVVKMLDRVSCQLPGSIIRVAAADFTRLDVASRLRDLAKAGCDVRVISRFEPQMFSPAKGVGDRLGSRLMILPYKGKTAQTKARNSIHAKMMIIDASIDGSKTKTPVVLTGSHNLDFFSLHTNDETMLEIQDRELFESYLKFWNRIDSDARASGMTLVFANDK